MLNQATKRNGSAPAPSRFGSPNGPDPREAGRRGGIRSGEVRRLKPLAKWEAGIFESRNGAAKAAVYKDKKRELAELLERQLEADRTYMQLCEWADLERERLDELQAETEKRSHAIAALEQREAELRSRLESDDGLDGWLLELGAERVTFAAIRLGWDVDDDDDVVTQP